jgi:hypothetical protein
MILPGSRSPVGSSVTEGRLTSIAAHAAMNIAPANPQAMRKSLTDMGILIIGQRAIVHDHEHLDLS